MKFQHIKPLLIVALAGLGAGSAWAQSMDMPGMRMPELGAPVASAAGPADPASSAAKSGGKADMNMPGMSTHEMSGTTPRSAKPTPLQTPVATQSGVKGMDMPGMQMQGTAATKPSPPEKSQGMPNGAPSQPRSADAYSDGYTLTSGPFIPPGVKPPHLDDQVAFGSVLVDRLEKAYTRNGNWTAYDVQAWFGHAFNRLMIKADGDMSQGRLQDARTELLWDHAVAAFWDMQAGVRHDYGSGPDRNWLAFGMQGLAPYWFDVEATGYLGNEGRSALRLAATYDLLITQRIVLQPRIEANLYGKDDPARQIGSGLSDATAGLRLRYEFTRQFAPYVGVEWSGKFSRSADYARAAGDKTSQTAIVAGLRFWF
ncbi:MAG: copper resistance protein B [Proteobacteria bacterium]|nr:copper resistance protein B [Pseudomonadota bacterium]